MAHGRSGELSRVETRFGQITRIQVTAPPYAAPHGSDTVDTPDVWALYGDSTLAHVDSSGRRMTESTLTGASSSAVTVGDGSVWVAKRR